MRDEGGKLKAEGAEGGGRKAASLAQEGKLRGQRAESCLPAEALAQEGNLRVV